MHLLYMYIHAYIYTRMYTLAVVRSMGVPSVRGGCVAVGRLKEHEFHQKSAQIMHKESF